MTNIKARANAFGDAALPTVPREKGRRGGRSLAETVVASLLKSFETNQVAPGDRLPSEWELCEQFGVSKTVIREAIANLKARGRLESRRGSGVFVRAAEADSPWRNVEFGQKITDILDILELRIGIEVEGAGLSAQRRTEAMLLEIADSVRAFRNAAQRNEVSGELDFAFHRSVAAGTGNRQFVLLLERLRDQLIPREVLGARFAAAELRPNYYENIIHEHNAIYEAIADRDPDAACAAMRRHLEGARKRYRDYRFSADGDAPAP